MRKSLLPTGRPTQRSMEDRSDGLSAVHPDLGGEGWSIPLADPAYPSVTASAHRSRSAATSWGVGVLRLAPSISPASSLPAGGVSGRLQAEGRVKSKTSSPPHAAHSGIGEPSSLMSAPVLGASTIHGLAAVVPELTLGEVSTHIVDRSVRGYSMGRGPCRSRVRGLGTGPVRISGRRLWGCGA